MNFLLLVLLSFIIGSVPTGLIIAKGLGTDPRKSGSGNIGATNILRTTGRWAAFFTLLGDMFKGALPLLIGSHYVKGVLSLGIIGLFAVLGHNYSVFLSFRGGKGVATSLGVLCIYSPQTAVITIIIWLMTVLITRYSSLGALVSFGLMPFFTFVLDERAKLPVAFALAGLLFFRHRENILRLIRGAEPRIGNKI